MAYNSTTGLNTTELAATGLIGNAIIERYMVGKLLTLADKNTVFYKLGNKVKIPPGENKVISFQRWERIQPPRTALTEGVTPIGTSLNVSRVTATAEQWGSFCTISDVMEMTVKYQPFQRAVELLGLQAAETLDREIQKVLLAGTNVYYPNAKTARSSLTSSDVIDTPTLRKIRARLKQNAAPGVSGSDNRKKFIGVCDAFSSADMMSDTTFIESAKFQNLEPLTTGEFGEWQGVRWQESNFIPSYKRHSAELYTTIGYTEAVPSGDTAIANTTHYCAVTAFDSAGFESIFTVLDNGTSTMTGTSSGSDDVIKFVLPALGTSTDSGVETPTASHKFDTGPVAYNIYAGTALATMTLQATNLPAGSYYLCSASTLGSINHIVYSTTGAVCPVQPPTGVTVHNLFIFGNEWFSVCEIDGIKTMLTPSGAQKGDELAQRRSVGWKFFAKALITNQNFGIRIESASANE